MDPLKPNDKQTQLAIDFKKSSKQQKHAEANIPSASSDMNKNYTPQSAKDKAMSVTELFPWLNEATEWNLKYLGSLTEVKPRQILKAMDTVIEYVVLLILL